jgi:hypothetical protein
MLLYRARFKVNHPYGYQPYNCKEGTITNIYWDQEARRLCLQLQYDNGAIDWIPLESFTDNHYTVGMGESK